MIKVNMLNESFCEACTKCPKCGNPPATISSMHGVLPCAECQVKMAHEDERMIPHYKSFKSKEEYWATPFWKHMGLKPKPEERAQEKMMKSKGLSYLDLARARNTGKNANFNNKKLVDAALKGELKSEVKKINDNRRQRPSGKSTKTIFT